MKTFVNIKNLDTNEVTTFKGETNDIKAMIFDMVLNREYDLAYVTVEEIMQDEEYNVYYKFNNDYATGGYFECDYQ